MYTTAYVQYASPVCTSHIKVTISTTLTNFRDRVRTTTNGVGHLYAMGFTQRFSKGSVQLQDDVQDVEEHEKKGPLHHYNSALTTDL